LRARIAVTTGRTVRLKWIVADPRYRVASASSVALVGWSAGHRIPGCAISSLTKIILGAGVSIVAGNTIGL
jgi:hypothetical protein